MADFKTHISASTMLGVGYGVVGYSNGMTWDSCVVAAGLCSVSGMLPDLDSDSGGSLRSGRHRRLPRPRARVRVAAADSWRLSGHAGDVYRICQTCPTK